MAEMSDINVQKLTIVQQAIASCCGAILTSLFGYIFVTLLNFWIAGGIHLLPHIQSCHSGPPSPCIPKEALLYYGQFIEKEQTHGECCAPLYAGGQNLILHDGMPVKRVTPLDVIKTRLQAQSNQFHKGKCFVCSSGLVDHVYVGENGDSKAWHKKPGHFKGTLDAFVKIIRIEGIKSLWSGLPPTLIMAIPTTAIYFTCYDQLSEALKNRPGNHDEHIPVIAGSLSRFGSATVVSPLELIKTQMQYRRWSYKELYLCISTRLAVDGWISLWGGWTSTILRDVPFSAMYWYNYERFKKMMCKEVGASEPTFFVSFTSGAASSSIAAVITQPFDVVKTYRQTQLWESETLKTPQRDRKSTWAVMRNIVARNGITGLFAGITPRLFKVAPACAIMISTYEYGKSFFSHLNEKKNRHP